MSSPLNVHLERYDGPLDLLLDLIRKQQIEIKDIPIATITSQYLEYMDKARELDIDLGAEFVYMAATLIHIKSRMLLPRDPALAQDNPGRGPAPGTGGKAAGAREVQECRGDAAAEADDRGERLVESADCKFTSEDDDPGLAITLFDLVKAFGELLERAKNRPVYEVSEEDVSVGQMILRLKSLFLEAGDEPVYIMRVFAEQRSRKAMITLFLAVLEVVKQQAVMVAQTDLFGEIVLRRHLMFDTVFAADEPAIALEREYR